MPVPIPLCRWLFGAVACAAALMFGATPSLAATTPTRDADVVAGTFIQAMPQGSVTNSAFVEIPPSGNPAAISDSKLAGFPMNGPTFAILSTGDAAAAEEPDSTGARSSTNGGGGGSHGGSVNDLVTLRVDLSVPEGRNCLTFDFRFLSEEFPEYLGSDFNDGFVAELDGSDFQVASTGDVDAPRNIAQDENGKVVTVNTTGTSADNALGTTYDGATPILSGTTPITPGAHQLYLSIYDVNDAVYDSSVFVDNLRLLNAKPEKCQKGAAPTPETGIRCQGKKATVIATDGVAIGTPKRDVIRGSTDDDEIRGRGGDDLICGRAGNDEIDGNGGEDDVRGNGGKDLLRGNTDDDVLGGGADDDRVLGRGGEDLLRGGSSDDRLRGNGGDDDIRGHQGDDVLHGNAGGDRLRGNGGENRCIGGSGSDDLGVGC